MSKAVLVGLGVFTGGLGGSALAINYMKANYKPELDFYHHKHAYGFEDFEPRGELSFTYYYDRWQGAFNHVAMNQIGELRRRGYPVRLREVHEWLFQFKHPDAESLNDFGIVHPLFFTAPQSLRFLEKKHRYVVGFEVADTTHVSPYWVKEANDPALDCLFVPSKFSYEAYTRSGVQNRVEVLPHGVSDLFTKPKEEVHSTNPLLRAIRNDPRPKILFFCLHSGKTRKGEPSVLRALGTLKGKGRDFVLVVKTFPKGTLAWYDARTVFPDLPLVQVDEWLTQEDIIYLYDSCDLLVHPYRGGSFELNVFEALARGLPVIVTGWGCVLEYCDFHTAYLIMPKDYVRVFPIDVLGFGKGGHIGWGMNPDESHFVELLEFVLDNLDYCKSRAQKNKVLYTKRTWRVVIEQFLKGVEQIWDTH